VNLAQLQRRNEAATIMAGALGPAHSVALQQMMAAAQKSGVAINPAGTVKVNLDANQLAENTAALAWFQVEKCQRLLDEKFPPDGFPVGGNRN